MTTESENVKGKVAHNPLPLDKVMHKVSLQFKGLPSRNKADKDEARKIEQRESMAEGTFSTTKSLIGKTDLAEFDKKKKALSDFFYANTLPPDQGKNGYSLVPSKSLPVFTTETKRLKRECEDAYSEFMRDYGFESPDQREKWLGVQASRLGGKFDASEYRSPEDMAKRFRINIPIEPFGDISESAGMWVDNETLSLLKRQEAEAHEAIADYASMAVWERVTDPLLAMVERLSEASEGDTIKADGTKGFKDSLVTNLRDIVEKLPVLNFQGDKRLEEVRTECQRLLKDIESPKALRTSPKKREDAKRSASDILKTVEGYGSGKRKSKVA